MERGDWQATVMGFQRVAHNLVTEQTHEILTKHTEETNRLPETYKYIKTEN